MEKLWSALALALMLLMGCAARADTAADAGTAVDRWAAAFNANDVIRWLKFTRRMRR